MELREYIKMVVKNFIEAEDPEVEGIRDLSFDIGVSHNGAGGKVIVQEDSTNRIKFTLEVKRS